MLKLSKMGIKLFQKFAALGLLLSIAGPGEAYMVNGNPYRQRETLDTNGDYILEWEYVPQRKIIVFNMTVKSDGFIGLGLARRQSMMDADIVIAGVNRDGTSYCKDMYTRGSRTLEEDSHQDWTLLKASEERGVTRLTLSRPISTCDEDDIEITKDRIVILWAYGETDELSYHHNNRGVIDAYLLDPNLAPATEPDSTGERGIYGSDNPDLIVWRLRRRWRLENRPTSYVASIHRGLQYSKPHHAIGFKTYIGSEAARMHTHHLIVYKCIAPEGTNPRDIFEPFVNYPGEENYVNENRRLPINFCREILYVWGIGGKPLFLTEDVGIPVGGQRSEYLLFETHFDNRAMRGPTDIEVGIDVFVTPRLRPRDGRILVLGFNIPGALLAYPPASIEANMIGHCAPECTNRMFPREGVRTSSIFLHAHQTGQKLSLRHFRKGKELPPVLSDDNFNPEYQQFRTLQEDVEFLPGDHLIMQCVLDNNIANGTTVSGFGTHQEMCSAFLVVDEDVEVDRCLSEFPSAQLLSHFGAQNVTWETFLTDRVVTIPHSLRGLTIPQVGDKYVKWTSRRRSELLNEQTYGEHIQLCVEGSVPSADEIIQAGRNATRSAQRQSPKPRPGQLQPFSNFGDIFTSTFSGFGNVPTTSQSLRGQIQRAVDIQLREGARALVQMTDPGALIMRASTGSPIVEQRLPSQGASSLGVPATVAFPRNAPEYNGNAGESDCSRVEDDHDRQNPRDQGYAWDGHKNELDYRNNPNYHQNIPYTNYGYKK